MGLKTSYVLAFMQVFILNTARPTKVVCLHATMFGRIVNFSFLKFKVGDTCLLFGHLRLCILMSKRKTGQKLSFASFLFFIWRIFHKGLARWWYPHSEIQRPWVCFYNEQNPEDVCMFWRSSAWISIMHRFLTCLTIVDMHSFACFIFFWGM